jgi:hypothetical protein
MTTRPLFASTILAAGLATATLFAQTGPQRPATDLDALMERAIAHRDQNWRKLSQYVLDEREDVEVRGPGGALALGDHREYTWFVRDGFFVRSPVRANGVTISEPDRLVYEQRWLKQEQGRQAARDRQAAERGSKVTTPAANTADTTDPAADSSAAQSGDLGSLLQQTREPRFVSAGYFLEFDFEPGNYYLAGRETLNGKPVLRVEYYPTNLFDDRRNRRAQNRDQDRNPRQDELQRQMNKTAMITLWVDPSSAEIMKGTFDNLGLDFIPGGWLLSVTDMRATIDMIEPFPGIWLPGALDMRLAVTLATGAYNLQYNLTYHNYKQAAVKATIRPRP